MVEVSDLDCRGIIIMTFENRYQWRIWSEDTSFYKSTWKTGLEVCVLCVSTASSSLLGPNQASTWG